MTVNVKGAAYAFHTINKITTLTYGERVSIGVGAQKITAFKKEGAKYLNMGTAIFESEYSFNHPDALTFRWVRDAGSDVQQMMVCITQNAIITDLSPKYRAEMKALMAKTVPNTYLSGLNRFWTVDWEAPFRMPGWAGIRELNVAVPGWKEALPWLEWHAVGSLGLKSFKTQTYAVQKALFGVALGGVGYLTGYEHELVDDTCSQFCSMGTNNDCDDFAVAAAAVIQSVLNREAPPMCALEAWIIKHVNEAHVVTGMAWPRNLRDAKGAKITCGHMWVEANMINERENVIVECTAGVIYYGDVKPISSTVRRGNPHTEYSPMFEWYNNKVVAIKKATGLKHGTYVTKRKSLPQINLPAWVTTLAHAPPSVKSDKTYSQSTPGDQINIFGSYATRLNDELPNHSHHINIKFLPFTTGTTTFMTMPFTTTYSHRDVGSYR